MTTLFGYDMLKSRFKRGVLKNCPNGVEWKTLGEVTEYEQPTAYLVKSTNYKNEYPTPVLTAGKTFILGYTDETDGIYQSSVHPVIIFDDFTTAHKMDFEPIKDKAEVIQAFFMYAQKKQKEEAAALIAEEKLNEEAAKRYIQTSLKHEYASEIGIDLNAVLPKLSPLNPDYLTKKQRVFRKIAAFVEKFKGVSGTI